MYPSKNLLPARLVRSLRGSVRISLLSSKSSTVLDQISGHLDNDESSHADETLPSIVEADENLSVHCFDDFEEISRDEIPDDSLNSANQENTSLPSLGRSTPEISPPFPLAIPTTRRVRPGRSKSVSHSLPQLSLSRSLSRSSLRTLPRRESVSPPRPNRHPPPVPKGPTKDLLFDFPKPPTHIPTFASPIDDSSSIFYDSDPFRRESHHSELSGLDFEAKRPHFPVVDPNTLPPSPPSTRPCSPSTIAPSESRSTVFRRFASLRSSFRVPRRPKVSRLTRRSSDPYTTFVPKTPPQAVDFHPLPEFVPEPFDLSFASDEAPNPHVENSSASLTPFITIEEEPESQPTPLVVSKDPLCTQHLAVPGIQYQCVNPLELTRSPSVFATPELYSLSATPLPSSPAWLSRNIQGLERPKLDISSILRGLPLDSACTPLSPAPIPIPPPVPVGHIPPPVPDIVITEEDLTEPHISHSPPYRSRHLKHRSISYSPTQRNSAIWKSRSPTIVAHSPSSFLRRSNSFSPEATPFTQDQLLFVESLPKTSSAPDLLSLPADNISLLTPIDLFDSDPPPPRAEHLDHPTSLSPHEFFVPTRGSAEADHHLKLPHHILHTVISALLYEASYFSEFTRMSFNIFGKPTETVDFGGEVDYSAYEWFKDPPPPRHAPSPAAAEAFVPQPGVIEQNEMFGFALRTAPNVLYARYKQYGQLGVLAWCSEFSELIDALKALGFDGNMFVATRTQALKTCEEILKLHTEVKMQIIIMYLSSQVARLRRFLDAEQQWDDYPLITFPLPP